MTQHLAYVPVCVAGSFGVAVPDWLALWQQAGAEVGTIQAGAFVPDAR